MKTVYAFDFDGTLTTRDTLLEFIRYVVGDVRFMCGFSLFSPLMVLMKLHIMKNHTVKQCFFSWFFKGTNIDTFDEWCRKFAHDKHGLLRPKGEMFVKDVATKSEVVIVSASIVNWVRHFFNGLNVTVIGTQLEVDNAGKLTGRFVSPNCYGQEKVSRLLSIFPHRASYHLIAFGDSKGDRELLNSADEGYYKPFREI